MELAGQVRDAAVIHCRPSQVEVHVQRVHDTCLHNYEIAKKLTELHVCKSTNLIDDFCGEANNILTYPMICLRLRQLQLLIIAIISPKPAIVRGRLR
jgi:hypothetical protein